MKGLTTVITIILGMMLFQCNSMAEEKKTVDISTQLASAQAQLKQIKTELELAKVRLQLKDKQLEALTKSNRSLIKKLKSISRKRSTSRNKYTQASQTYAARQAAQKQQQRQQYAKRLKYYESGRSGIYRQIRSAEKRLKEARETIGKSRRRSNISQAKSKLKKLYYKRNSINSQIKNLKLQML